MDAVREAFARVARMAAAAGFDWLQLHAAHGYLVASFLSPLTNRRADEYGGPLERRARFPLEVLDAVRAEWPAERPLSVAISASDCAPGGLELDEAMELVRLLATHGCDLVEVLAGQTTVEAEPAYGRGFLTPLSEQIRNGAGIPTLVGGHLTTANELNTLLAAGRTDLRLFDPS